jgi:hypothetical protein
LRGPSPRSSSLADVAKDAAEDLLELVTAQIKLARLEVSVDLRRALKRMVGVALFIPPLVIGYAFGMAAVASWLGAYWGRPLALAAVAALQIIPAVGGILWSLALLRRTRVLGRAGAEMSQGVQRTLAVVTRPLGPSNA